MSTEFCPIFWWWTVSQTWFWLSVLRRGGFYQVISYAIKFGDTCTWWLCWQEDIRSIATPQPIGFHLRKMLCACAVQLVVCNSSVDEHFNEFLLGGTVFPIISLQRPSSCTRMEKMLPRPDFQDNFKRKSHKILRDCSVKNVPWSRQPMRDIAFYPNKVLQNKLPRTSESNLNPESLTKNIDLPRIKIYFLSVTTIKTMKRPL